MNEKFAKPGMKDGSGVKGKARGSIAKAAKSAERREESAAQRKAGLMRVVFEIAKKGGRENWDLVVGNVEKEDVDTRDGHGRTLLMLAAMQGNMDSVKSLVEKGAYKSVIDECERSALMHAMLNGHHDVAKWLKEKGADWKADLEIAVRDRRKLLIYSMIEVLGVTGDDVAEAEAKFDPKRGPPVAHRVKGVGDDALAVMDLERMFTDHTVSKPAPKGGSSKGEEQAPRKHEPIGEFIC